MKLSKAMKKMNLFLICVLLGAGMPIISVSASEDENTNADMPDQSLYTDGTYYEFPSMDAQGNITIVRLPEVDEAAIEQERMETATGFEVVAKSGNKERILGSYDSLEEAQNAIPRQSFRSNAASSEIRAVNDYSNIKYGVVDFRTKTSQYNTNYTETKTGFGGYLNGSYGADGAFLGYCSTDQSKVKFRMGGVEGCVSASDVIVRDVDDTDVRVSFYRVESGKLLHYVKTQVVGTYYATVTNVGLKQSYMKDNVAYFSYDGHYFYETYEQMIDDYKQDTFAHAINADQPYYNYFQFLSHRSKTDFTAAQLDANTAAKVGSSSSKMSSLGSAFLSNQDKYGANALLMYGVAANESYWGMSNIALNKNNIFGHNATDFNPGGNADSYASPKDSVEHHAKVFISDGYLDPKDVSGRYFGAHLGDKGSGMNVKYASDPYWGEKAAAVANNISQSYQNKDFGKYTIGMIDKGNTVRIRKEATTSSTALYDTRGLGNYPILILAKTNGENINGNTMWYKIQSDPTLNSDRSATTQGTYTYDYGNMYLYISAEYVNLVDYTNLDNDLDNETEEYKLGDINGDGKIDARDLLKVERHIVFGGTNTLTGNAFKAADINGDSKLNALDLLKIEKHIVMGTPLQ